MGKAVVLLIIPILVGVGLTWSLWPEKSSEGNPNEGPRVLELLDPPESTWISPGKYLVSNLGPGDTADVPVTLRNGNSVDTTWVVEARTPTNPSRGFEPWPWPGSVTIGSINPTLSPGEQLPIAIELAMPKDVEYKDRLSEVWIVFYELGQEGMVHTELATKVQIETR